MWLQKETKSKAGVFTSIDKKSSVQLIFMNPNHKLTRQYSIVVKDNQICVSSFLNRYSITYITMLA